MAGASAAPGAPAANEPFCALFNTGTGGKSIWLREVGGNDQNTAGDRTYALYRTSTRGTPGSTVTPDADNDFQHRVSPPSGAVLDLAGYTALPTLAATPLRRTYLGLASTTMNGFIWVFDERAVEIPAGEGVAVVSPPGVDLRVHAWFFTWDE